MQESMSSCSGNEITAATNVKYGCRGRNVEITYRCSGRLVEMVNRCTAGEMQESR